MQKKTLSYTAIDFYEELPPEEKKAIDVVSSLTKNDCKSVMSQVVLITRTRSIFLKYTDVHDLNTKFEKAGRNSRNRGDIWEKQPQWWGEQQCVPPGTSSTGRSTRHDMLLCKSLLDHGFGGIIEKGGVEFMSITGHDNNCVDLFKKLGFTKSSIQDRANQVVRELDSLEGSEELIRLLAKRKKKPLSSSGGIGGEIIQKKTTKYDNVIDLTSESQKRDGSVVDLTTAMNNSIALQQPTAEGTGGGGLNAFFRKDNFNVVKERIVVS